MSRFVRPELITLPITDGDTLTIKRRLTAGEQREAYTRMYRPGLDGNLHVNPMQTGLAMMTTYLVDWSLRDDDGELVPIKGLSVDELEGVLNNLDPESFQEIKDAIEAHQEAMVTEREQEKKLRAGLSNVAPISPSPSDADGVLSGSVN